MNDEVIKKGKPKVTVSSQKSLCQEDNSCDETLEMNYNLTDRQWNRSCPRQRDQQWLTGLREYDALGERVIQY